MKKSARKELFDERCNKLRLEAVKLQRNWLYSWEAADVMGVNVCNMHSYNKAFVSKNADIPEIVFSNPGRKNVRRPPKMDNAEQEIERHRDYYYPSGLQVSSWRRLSNGQVAYMVK